MTQNWLITIPKTVPWESWMAEVEDAKTKDLFLFYRVGRISSVRPQDRCFILWNGKVRGWLPIHGIERSEGFTCQTTGQSWAAGTYLVRRPEWHPVDGPELKGFQGIRRLPLNFLESILVRPR